MMLDTTPFMADEEPIASSSNPPPTSSSESFNTFFENWLREQNSHLEELVTAANNHNHNHNNNENDSALLQLIEKVVRQYEQYYRTKSDWEKRDAIAMYAPSWLSNLEDAFLWIGGWRPTLAIHLLYSILGIQVDAKLHDLIRGITTGDLSDLASKQMEKIDELHRKIIHEERVLTEKLAKVQETAADRSMVELSIAVSEMMRNGGGDGGESEERVQEVLEVKCGEMEELLHMADHLRLETLKAVIEILTPIQAVYFLIAKAELYLRLHEWGKKRGTIGKGVSWSCMSGCVRVEGNLVFKF
ncbi:putative transcription factor TGA like domain-containing protein [Helianthus annuus]|uniref:Transcription factor TGA like domain-containing protein n=2 Tax=Helianthus annuus TaxID=4232 RepID=A0A251S650_HELAN|nr:putative transcription factor TGA like domain-containing protein [Helianthus annuus]KAJ0450119.1 putative transcription factor TGA like domain-containing protein [Helianthus annuus]KAJ0471902.1 putative transcription factor TGA like domain-containing protein [Helianthus annuus]KAJ0651384.1 putative transcription factor TGA like domain-containing protein [Helianthus annuus]KAJ0829958.1 putative transcription factor TGA like domain-containing protein [Helianthus annuus]